MSGPDPQPPFAMLILLSPAKKLDFDAPPASADYSVPAFLSEAQSLVKTARGLSPEQLSGLMDLSEPLAQLCFERFIAWRPAKKPAKGVKQVALAFQGDVYKGLQAEKFSAADFRWAQKRLRIFSGLYGLLRPLDLIVPYRLSMGSAMANPRGADVYSFWGERISERINEDLRASGAPAAIINLASQEYFKAARAERLEGEIWTPSFREKRNGRYRIISFSAKKARGRMSAWLIKNRVKDPEQIREFAEDGYRWSKALSSGRELAFTRPAPGG